jgi:hypothetical protein
MHVSDNIRIAVPSSLCCEQDQWVVAPCRLAWVYRRYSGPYCLHHQGDRPYNAGSTDVWNVGKLMPHYTALQSVRTSDRTKINNCCCSCIYRNACVMYTVLTETSISVERAMWCDEWVKWKAVQLQLGAEHSHRMVCGALKKWKNGKRQSQSGGHCLYRAPITVRPENIWH